MDSSDKDEKFVLKPLPYPYSGLEPVIKKCFLWFHHKEVGQAFVNNLNDDMDKLANRLEVGDMANLNLLLK